MDQFVCENRIWDPAETLPRDQLHRLQISRLKKTIEQARNIPFYKTVFEKNNVSANMINQPDDIRLLPFTTKEDLRQNYPLNFCAIPRKDIVRIHGSSGTTGKPTFVPYSSADRELWANLCARFLVAGGLRSEHLVHIAFGYGLFTGGFGLHYGVEKVGAAILPAAAGNTPRQIMLLHDIQADVLICTPSYALQIAEVARSQGLDPRTLSLKFAHLGGEPWTEDMRIEIERQLGLIAFNNYGLSEVIGPGVSGECAARTGMHIQEDHFIVECLDPETLDPVAPGTPGELVFTSLSKEAMPVIRYRTRDIATLDYAPCPCGRTTVRMGRVVGRSDDMLIIRGVNVFPSQIEEALLRVEGTAPQYLIEVERPGALDEVTVHVEMRPEIFSDKMSNLQALHDKLDKEIHSVAGIRVKVNLVEPQTLERSMGKAKRVIDHRQEKK
jgi:phenylacetate-CoA ligase